MEKVDTSGMKTVYHHVTISGFISKNFPKQMHSRSRQAAIVGSILSIPYISHWETETEGSIHSGFLRLPTFPFTEIGSQLILSNIG